MFFCEVGLEGFGISFAHIFTYIYRVLRSLGNINPFPMIRKEYARFVTFEATVFNGNDGLLRPLGSSSNLVLFIPYYSHKHPRGTTKVMRHVSCRIIGYQSLIISSTPTIILPSRYKQDHRLSLVAS